MKNIKQNAVYRQIYRPDSWTSDEPRVLKTGQLNAMANYLLIEIHGI